LEEAKPEIGNAVVSADSPQLVGIGGQSHAAACDGHRSDEGPLSGTRIVDFHRAEEGGTVVSAAGVE